MHRQHVSIPGFPKVGVLPLHFYERPVLVLFLLTKRNPKRIFAFTKKKAVAVLVIGLL